MNIFKTMNVRQEREKKEKMLKADIDYLLMHLHESILIGDEIGKEMVLQELRQTKKELDEVQTKMA